MSKKTIQTLGSCRRLYKIKWESYLEVTTLLLSCSVITFNYALWIEWGAGNEVRPHQFWQSYVSCQRKEEIRSDPVSSCTGNAFERTLG